MKKPHLYEISFYKVKNGKISAMFWFNGRECGGNRVLDKETLKTQINTIIDNIDF